MCQRYRGSGRGYSHTSKYLPTCPKCPSCPPNDALSYARSMLMSLPLGGTFGLRCLLSFEAARCLDYGGTWKAAFTQREEW